MDATELSERIRSQIEAGAWAQAINDLHAEWQKQNPFGRIVCDRAGYAEVWVQFKTSGYPFSLRRKWDKATSEETLGILLTYVEAWNVPDIAGNIVALPGPDYDRPGSILDDVEDALVFWLIAAFVRFWLSELPNPRKN